MTINPSKTFMKKFIACLTLACLASLTVSLAGEAKSSGTNKAAKAKATSSAKANCADKTDCSTTTQTTSSCTEKSACCEKEQITKKVVKPDLKGATFLVKR